MIMKTNIDYSLYSSYFSQSEMWNKIKNSAQKAGIKVIYAALLLYYASTDKSISILNKTKIYGALGYFILPIDLLPDFTPILGYTDDMTALLCCLKAIWVNLTPEIKEIAKNKLQEWFETIKESDLKILSK